MAWPDSKARFSILLFAILAQIGVLHAQNEAEAQKHAASGVALVGSQNFAEAEQEFRKAVHAAPKIAAYHAQLGSVLGLEGKWKESLQSLQEAVELEPSNVSFRREAAAVEWQLGLFNTAEKNLDYVLKSNPADAGAMLLLGMVSDAQGNYERAVELLTAQFDLVVAQPDRTVILFHSLYHSPEKSYLLRLVGTLQSHVGDPPWIDAISRCAAVSASEADLNTAETLFSLIPRDNDREQRAAALPLAALRYRSGRIVEAQTLLEQLIQRGWISADAQTLLGKCFESQHQATLAYAAYSKALELDPSDIARYDDLISLDLDSGKISDGEALANRAVTVAPTNARAWVLKGNAQLRGNVYKGALQSYKQAAKLDPSDPDTMLLIGGVHFITGDYDAAIAEYQAGIKRFPNDSRFYVNYSEVLLGSPEIAEQQSRAQSLLEKAIQLAPDSAEAHYQLGQLALRQGRLQDAEREFLASIASEPDLSKTHYALSLVYRRMRRSDESEKQFAIFQQLKRAEENGPRGTAGRAATDVELVKP